MIIALVASVGLRAQSSGTLNGVITDSQSGDPIPFANVTIEQNGNIVTGGSTDFNGNFSIKPIPAGKYTVSASNLGYTTLQFNNVQIPAGQITFQNFKLSPAAEMLGEVEIQEYKVPLIAKDQTTSGGTVTSEDIAKMPGRSAAAVAITVGGVYSEDGESVGSVRGARSDATVYYVDGVKVRGTSSIPKSALEQVQVITGGLPAQYGDVTGGVISMTMKGPSSEYFGSVEAITSTFLDPFGYNLIGLNLSGPLWAITEDGTNRKRTVAGFLFAVEGTYEKDGAHSTTGVWRANDDVINRIRQNPLKMERGIIYNNVDYLKSGDFTRNKSYANIASRGVNIAGKIDISPIRDLNITLGGTLDYSKGKTNAGQMFNYENNGDNIYNNWRAYARLSQRFRDNNEEKASIIKNPYYQIQVDYSKTSSKTYNEKFGDNFFRYGHVGNFNVESTKFYEYKTDTVTQLTGWVLENFVERVSGFSKSDYNPDLGRYAEQYFEFFPYSYPNIQMISQYGGLINGESAPGAYSLTGSGPGTPASGYGYSNLTQFRVAASGSADIGGHELSLGFEFEQRKDAVFQINSTIGLWTLARQLMNSHITEKDLKNPIVKYENGFFNDTIDYPRLYNGSAQSAFDENFRTYLGLEKNSLVWINVDGYNPDELKFEWFSADELFNQGTSYVSYYGYDYKGEKLTYRPTLDDFFTREGSNGRLERPIAPFEPNYIAGYIQDKFAFKDLIFNIGIRVDRYDANQLVLKDKYLLSEAYTRGDNDDRGLISNFRHPSGIPSDAVVYVNTIKNPTEIKGYRVGDVWYTASGVEVENPRLIEGSNGIAPYLINSDQELTSKAFEDYKPQTKILPRISFSFPISEEALFFAHYDILSKRPSTGNRLNPIEYLYIRNLSQNTLNNPNLKPEMTVDYELGFQQKLGNSSALKLSAFYREMRDMLQTVAVKGAYPTDYYTLGNIDFGTVKGFTVMYDLRRTGNVTLRASYTLQFAKGTGSNSGSQDAIVKSSKPNLKTTIPLNFDQRHGLAISLDYRYGGKASGTPYAGPKIAGKSIFANTGVNFTINSGSGSPYTRYNKPKEGIIVGTMNGARKPWRTTIDMRVDRDIKIKLADAKEGGTKEKYSYMNIYLEVRNLLNTKNIINVYSYTGNPDDDGYLTHTEYQSRIQTQTDAESYRNYYAMAYQYNDNNYSFPRTIRLGVQFTF